MATRFTDDLIKNTDGSDFIVRRHVPVGIQIFLIFSIAFEIIYITGEVMNTTGSSTLFLVTLLLTIGALTWFTIFTSASLRDLVLATEFQNAMLASAAQLSTRFCLITKQDGSIVYVDQGFQRIFPHFMQSTDRDVDGLFIRNGAQEDVVGKMVQLLQNNENGRLMLQLRDEQNNLIPVVLSVDMLPRPKGYFLMRGRDYVEKRDAESEKALVPTSGLGLEQALARLPEGIFVTDAGGVIIYANRTLEEWLGFHEGEMHGPAFKLSNLIYQYGGREPGRLVQTDFDGDAVLQCKDRSLITCHIRQVASGKSTSVSALVSISDSAAKKA